MFASHINLALDTFHYDIVYPFHTQLATITDEQNLIFWSNAIESLSCSLIEHASGGVVQLTQSFMADVKQRRYNFVQGFTIRIEKSSKIWEWVALIGGIT